MVLGRLAYLLGLLGAGLLARRAGLLDDTRRRRLNAVAFYVALPALVFTATHDQSFAGVASLELVVGLWAVLFATAALAWALTRGLEPDGRRSVAVVQSYHGNLGYLGLPLVVTAVGETAGAAASLVLGALVVVQVPLTVLVLVRLNSATASFRRELRRLLTNPVLLAIGAGLTVSALDVAVPARLVGALDPLAALALPLALVLVGGSLDPGETAVDLRATGPVVAVKVGAMPALAAVVFTLLGVAQPVFVAAVVMLAMPTAVSTYVYATELGGDPAFASTNVLVTTVVAVVTLVGLLQYLAG